MTAVTGVSASFLLAVPLLALGLLVLAFAVYCEVDAIRADAVRHLPNRGLLARRPQMTAEGPRPTSRRGP